MHLDAKEGMITAYDERFLLIPVKLIHSIEDRLTQTFGPATATSFEYEIGREGGANYVRIAKKAGLNVKNLQDLRDLQVLAERLGTLRGWGKQEIREFDTQKGLCRIRWTHGVSVRSKKGKTPVCHFRRGLMTGAIEAVLGSRCESLETSCEGKGDNYCEAIIGNPSAVALVADMKTRTNQ
jgi:predicted hydrocarbon binding protein